MNDKSKLKSHIVTTFVSIFILMISGTTYSQNIGAKHIESTVIIDGVVDEEVWNDAEFLTDFIQFEPYYNTPSSFITFVKVLY